MYVYVCVVIGSTLYETVVQINKINLTDEDFKILYNKKMDGLTVK